MAASHPSQADLRPAQGTGTPRNATHCRWGSGSGQGREQCSAEVLHVCVRLRCRAAHRLRFEVRRYLYFGLSASELLRRSSASCPSLRPARTPMVDRYLTKSYRIWMRLRRSAAPRIRCGVARRGNFRLRGEVSARPKPSFGPARDPGSI